MLSYQNASTTTGYVEMKFIWDIFPLSSHTHHPLYAIDRISSCFCLTPSVLTSEHYQFLNNPVPDQRFGVMVVTGEAPRVKEGRC